MLEEESLLQNVEGTTALIQLKTMECQKCWCYFQHDYFHVDYQCWDAGHLWQHY